MTSGVIFLGGKVYRAVGVGVMKILGRVDVGELQSGGGLDRMRYMLARDCYWRDS